MAFAKMTLFIAAAALLVACFTMRINVGKKKFIDDIESVNGAVDSASNWSLAENKAMNEDNAEDSWPWHWFGRTDEEKCASEQEQFIRRCEELVRKAYAKEVDFLSKILEACSRILSIEENDKDDWFAFLGGSVIQAAMGITEAFQTLLWTGGVVEATGFGPFLRENSELRILDHGGEKELAGKHDQTSIFGSSMLAGDYLGNCDFWRMLWKRGSYAYATFYREVAPMLTYLRHSRERPQDSDEHPHNGKSRNISDNDTKFLMLALIGRQFKGNRPATRDSPAKEPIILEFELPALFDKLQLFHDEAVFKVVQNMFTPKKGLAFLNWSNLTCEQLIQVKIGPDMSAGRTLKSVVANGFREDMFCVDCRTEEGGPTKEVLARVIKGPTKAQMDDCLEDAYKKRRMQLAWK